MPEHLDPHAHLVRQEKLRGIIPAELLIRMNSLAALTGKVVKYDDAGNILPEEPDYIGGKDRLAMSGKLMDLAVSKTPASPKDLPAPPPDPQDLLNKAQNLDQLSNQELDKLIEALEAQSDSTPNV